MPASTGTGVFLIELHATDQDHVDDFYGTLQYNVRRAVSFIRPLSWQLLTTPLVFIPTAQFTKTH